MIVIGKLDYMCKCESDLCTIKLQVCVVYKYVPELFRNSSIPVQMNVCIAYCTRYVISINLPLSMWICVGTLYTICTTNIKVNEKSCRLRMATYRDDVKRKGDKIGMGV